MDFTNFEVKKLSDIIRSYIWMSAKSYLAQILKPVLTIVYTLHKTESKLSICAHRFYRTINRMSGLQAAGFVINTIAI